MTRNLTKLEARLLGLGTTEADIVSRALRGRVYPAMWVGTGRRTKFAGMKAADGGAALRAIGLIGPVVPPGVDPDFRIGQDKNLAPRGGMAGEYIGLTRRGKRRVARMFPEAGMADLPASI